MIKEHSNKFLFLFSIIILICFNSCSKDDPVTPPPIDSNYSFDSSRYAWTINTSDFYFITFDSFIDSTLFFLNSDFLRRSEGSSFTDYSFSAENLSAISMAGSDNNTIYIGGSDLSFTNYDKPKLIKWNGLSFENISISNPKNRKYQISSIFIQSNNEIFLGSTRGDIILLSNGVYEFNQIDSTFIITSFAVDEQNNIYCVAQKNEFNSTKKSFVQIYKKENSLWKWQIVFSETYNNYIDELFPTSVGKILYATQNNIIKKFNNTGFVPVLNDIPFDLYPLAHQSDTVITSILTPGIINGNATEKKIFQWNGKKWSIELDFRDKNIFAQFINKVKKVSDKYYFLAVDEIQKISYIGKGIKK